MTRTCSCPDHQNSSTRAPAEIDGHVYRLDTEDALDGHEKWRYRCSCGGHGAWNLQSSNVPYHAWLDHVRRAKRRKAERHYLQQLEDSS